MLHAGGKFGGSGYKVSGGLHGVGVSVVNALSSRLVVEVDRDGKRHRMEFAKGGKPQGKLEVIGKAPRGRTGTTVTFWPDPTVFEEHRLPGADAARAAADDGVPQQAASRSASSTSAPTTSRAGHLQVQRRHRRLREARQQPKEALFKQGRLLRAGRGRPGGRDRVPVEHRLLPRASTRFANGIATDRGRHARGGLQEGPHQRRQPVRTWQGPAEGEGRQPPRRGHPRGPHRDHLGEAARPAVRGPDQGQARQRVDALARRAGHQREAGRLARGAPHRGPQDRAEGDAAPHGPVSRPARPATLTRRKSALEGAGMPDKLKDCSHARPARRRAVHRRGRLGRRFGRQGPRPADAGDPADPRQDPQRRAGPHRQDAQEHRDPDAHLGHRRGRRRRVRRRQDPLPQGHRSWPTPTSTAATSARCCSRSSSAR